MLNLVVHQITVMFTTIYQLVTDVLFSSLAHSDEQSSQHASESHRNHESMKEQNSFRFHQLVSSNLFFLTWYPDFTLNLILIIHNARGK